MSILRRTPTRSTGRTAVPWKVVSDVAREGKRHWGSRLSKREQRRLLTLVKQSRGRPGRLTVREQRELRRLVEQLDLRSFATHAAATVVARREPGTKARGR